MDYNTYTYEIYTLEEDDCFVSIGDNFPNPYDENEMEAKKLDPSFVHNFQMESLLQGVIQLGNSFTTSYSSYVRRPPNTNSDPSLATNIYNLTANGMNGIEKSGCLTGFYGTIENKVITQLGYKY